MSHLTWGKCGKVKHSSYKQLPASEKKKNSSLASHSFRGMTIDSVLLTLKKKECWLPFSLWEIFTSTNDNCTETSCKNDEKSYARWYVSAGFSAVRCGDEGASGKSPGVGVTMTSSGLRPHACLGTKARLRLSEYRIYLNMCPNDAEDDITTYRKAIFKNLDSVYLQTLFWPLPN